MHKSSSPRTIKKIWKSEPTIEGAGVHLKRAFGFHEVPQFDPFLLMDDFGSDNPKEFLPGFPWHPHRGIETITYVLDGDVEHQDSMGNGGVISAGDVQWMTAGGGILHQEMPKGNRKGQMYGFQLWANLPAKSKMMNPRYRGILQKDIPQVKTADGALVRVICGQVAGVQGPAKEIVSDPEYLDVSLPAGRVFTHPVKAGHTVFAYVIEGEGYFDQGRDAYARDEVGANYFDMTRSCVCGSESLVLYNTQGENVTITADKKSVRFLLVSGKPLKEPVAWYGPIVMNTREELRQAFEEFEKGTFARQPQSV